MSYHADDIVCASTATGIYFQSLCQTVSKNMRTIHGILMTAVNQNASCQHLVIPKRAYYYTGSIFALQSHLAYVFTLYFGQALSNNVVTTCTA